MLFYFSPSLGEGGLNCRPPMRKRSRSDVTATVDDIKRVSMAATEIPTSAQGSTKSTKGPEPHLNGKIKGIEKTDNVRKQICINL